MGWLALQMTKLTHRTVISTLEVASTEKLIGHYNTCVTTYRETDDLKCQMLISDMQMKVAEELARRGVITDMARAMANQ